MGIIVPTIDVIDTTSREQRKDGNLIIGGDFTVEGNAVIGGTLDLTGNLITGETTVIDMSKQIFLGNGIIICGNDFVDDARKVWCTEIICSRVYSSGDITTDADLDAMGDLTANTITMNEFSVAANGSTIIGGTLDVAGDFAVLSNASVGGDVNINTIGKKLYFRRTEGLDRFLEYDDVNDRFHINDNLKIKAGIILTEDTIEQLENLNLIIKGYPNKDIQLTPQGTGTVYINGVLDCCAHPFKPKFYSQVTEPDIPNDTMSMWWKTDKAEMWLMVDMAGSQYKVRLT